MTLYHVTPKWDGNDLETAASRLGEVEAIEMFLAKWEIDDASFAADQVTKIYLYATFEQAQEHQAMYDGEILEIDDRYLEVFTDWSEGIANLAVRHNIPKSDIRRLS
jgi:hypothetical protein